MQTVALLYGSTVLVFLVLDAVGLTFLIRPHFERHVGDLLVDGFRLGPAAVFYAFYIGALIWLVSWPQLGAEGYGRLILNAAIFGAVGYGTYEFTNFATLKAWTWSMVALDLTWGIVLTTTAAVSGVWLTRWLAA